MNKISDEKRIHLSFSGSLAHRWKIPYFQPPFEEEIHAFFSYKHQTEEMEQSLNFKTVTEMLQVPSKIYHLHVLFSNPDNKVEEHLVETHTSHSEKV